MKTETWSGFLPVFPGFYGTGILNDDNDNQLREYLHEDEKLQELGYSDKILKIIDIDFDYEKFQSEYGKAFTKEIESELKTLNLVAEIKFTGIYSPKFYNFENDSIDCDYVLTQENVKQIKKYLKETEEDFQAWIKERYTSCDGFISGHSNCHETFIQEETENFTEFSCHSLGSIFQFILENEEKADYCNYAQYVEVYQDSAEYIKNNFWDIPFKDYLIKNPDCLDKRLLNKILEQERNDCKIIGTKNGFNNPVLISKVSAIKETLDIFDLIEKVNE